MFVTNIVDIITDIIFICVIISGAVIGYKKGFVLSLVGIVENIGSIILTVSIMDDITDYMMESAFYTHLVKIIEGVFPFDNIAKSVAQGDSVFGGKILGPLFENFATIGGSLIIKNLAEGIANILINIAVFGLLFFGFKLFIKLVGKIANLVFKIPGISFLNKSAGFLMGGLKLFIVIYTVSALVFFIIPHNYESFVTDYINTSFFYKTVIDQNVILNIIN